MRINGAWALILLQFAGSESFGEKQSAKYCQDAAVLNVFHPVELGLVPTGVSIAKVRKKIFVTRFGMFTDVADCTQVKPLIVY